MVPKLNFQPRYTWLLRCIQYRGWFLRLHFLLGNASKNRPLKKESIFTNDYLLTEKTLWGVTIQPHRKNFKRSWLQLVLLCQPKRLPSLRIVATWWKPQDDQRLKTQGIRTQLTSIFRVWPSILWVHSSKTRVLGIYYMQNNDETKTYGWWRNWSTDILVISFFLNMNWPTFSMLFVYQTPRDKIFRKGLEFCADIPQSSLCLEGWWFKFMSRITRV